MLNLLVCAKQVPDTTIIKIDPVKHTLIRTGVPSILNTFDSYAMETALRIKEAAGGAKITVICMGPEQAKDILRECVSVGADETYLITDRVFGGSDTLATSNILSETVRYLEEKQGAPFDIIFCGKQAIDGDTGQVGPELSRHLGRPLITYAMEAKLEGDVLKVRRENDEGYDIYSARLPLVVTVTKTHYDMRYPSLKGKLNARKAEIGILTSAEIVVPEDKRGLNGSPTKVKKTYTPDRQKAGQKIIKDKEPAAAAKELAELIVEAKLIN